MRVKVVSLLGPLTARQERHAGQHLWVAGDRDIAAAPMRVAVVGSRRASELGLRRASKISAQLAGAGAVIVSGLALGIDAAAHRACIRAGGRTIAVIGTALERCYPAEHRHLQNRIADQHLLVSPFEPGHPTESANFIRRNRVMALFAHASVVVEAGDASGTKSHALEQRRLGRPVFVMRSLLERPGTTWPRKLVDDGDATVLDDIEQVLEAIQPKCSRASSLS